MSLCERRVSKATTITIRKHLLYLADWQVPLYKNQTPQSYERTHAYTHKEGERRWWMKRLSFWYMLIPYVCVSAADAFNGCSKSKKNYWDEKSRIRFWFKMNVYCLLETFGLDFLLNTFQMNFIKDSVVWTWHVKLSAFCVRLSLSLALALFDG